MSVKSLNKQLKEPTFPCMMSRMVRVTAGSSDRLMSPILTIFASSISLKDSMMLASKVVILTDFKHTGTLDIIKRSHWVMG